MKFLDFYNVCACTVTDVECCRNEPTDVKGSLCALLWWGSIKMSPTDHGGCGGHVILPTVVTTGVVSNNLTQTL